VITVIFFLFNVLPGDPARMMLDQNENSEQLALRRSMVLTNPLLPSIYTISMTITAFTAQ
jgi:ABC-type dipeptide/oligopeptide/nickel transport system permease component